MPVTINGTTGIVNDSGYTGDGVSFADATPANTLVTTAGGNVGVGTGSPVGKLDVSGGTGTIAYFRGVSGTYNGIAIQQSDASGSVYRAGFYDILNENAIPVANFLCDVNADGSSSWLWSTTPAGARTSDRRIDRMRLDSSGNLLVGTTSAISGTQTIQVVNPGSDSTQLRVRCSGAVAGRHWRYGADSSNTLYVINQDSTGVYMSNGNTGWTGLSDERYKDIIEPITGAAEKVASLRAVIGKFKTDEDGKRRAFLIAQDVQAVLPEAVDASNPERLGVTQTDVIPLLVAAIKEQQTLITALTARVAALEGTQP